MLLILFKKSQRYLVYNIKIQNPKHMSTIEQSEIRLKIAQIIERSRHNEELFLIDSKTAASHIIQFLQKNNLIEGFYQENILHIEN